MGLNGQNSVVFDELNITGFREPRILESAAKLNALCQTEIVEVIPLYRTDIVEDLLYACESMHLFLTQIYFDLC